MLRERRRHANFKPNRRLDRKSSRGMIFENEELRLRTININAEVERGQSDIRKLRRENDQLRREIWCLRDEYDRLDKLLRHNMKEGGKNASDSEDSGESCDTCGEEEDEAIEEEEEEEVPPETAESTENEQNNLKANLHVKFDHLSIVSEENLACSGSSSSHTSPHQTAFSALSPPDTPDLPKINDLQSVGPPLSHFENIFAAIPHEKPITPRSPLPPRSPTAIRNFQSGGNLDDLLQDIEALSQGILQMQNRENVNTTSLESPKMMTKYRSEVNLVLSTNDAEAEKAQKPDIILMQSEIKPPEPMPILSALYPHQPERKNIVQQPKDNFDAILAHLPSVSSHILTPKILSTDETGSPAEVKEDCKEKSPEREKNKTLNCPSSEDSRRKSRRVSLYFNGKKNEEPPAKESSSGATPKIPIGFERVSGDSSSATPGPAGGAQHHRKNSEVPTKHKKKRSHRNSHQPPLDELAFERNSLASSRESSASASTRSQKSRRISINSHAGGKIPWCACWGNGCI
ncbi:uncharacterized protein LOC132260185 [Phlebotomus argentipes]|uniref:uncharacterized protein LOC132260185 n=1 Tax=Phlebotomus argentipes TaxID=94469 RepID=UPI0028937669|nr:uncharacterized protein LOC132260185 [Phlebotomus argentipes]XP_059614134.1 uncharacterized protein LOC132260185 [Phlebotomus argentipes]